MAADGGLEDREGAGGELSPSVSGLMGVKGGYDAYLMFL